MTPISMPSSISLRADFDHSNMDIVKSGRYLYITNIKCVKCDRSLKIRIDSYKSGTKCKHCAIHKDSFEKFLNQATQRHADTYIYNATTYINKSTKIDILCKKCEQVFHQTPHKHLLGQGCPKCGKLKIGSSSRRSISSFISKSIAIHNDLYDYSLVKYINCNVDVYIKCNKCGAGFHQTPYNHLKGHGCFQCSMKKVGDLYRSSTGEFINKAIAIHGERYDYQKVNYHNNVVKITIICRKCSKTFEQTPSSHLQGNGCGCHTASLGQQQIFDFVNQHTTVIQNDRNKIRPSELDLYLPAHQLAIEYNGLYYHSYHPDDGGKPDPSYHQRKTIACELANIRLIQVFENEWYNSQDLVKSIICAKIGKFESIYYARKLTCRGIGESEASIFFNSNHINGHRPASTYIGLYTDDQLLCGMAFSRHQKYQYELIRYASKMNTLIVGGASRIFTRFLRDTSADSVLSYADRRYSNGDLYRTLGFAFTKTTKPNYYYIKRLKLYSRQQFQKHKLNNKLQIFDQNLSESENMYMNGYRKLWDAGHFKFVYSRA